MRRARRRFAIAGALALSAACGGGGGNGSGDEDTDGVSDASQSGGDAPGDADGDETAGDDADTGNPVDVCAEMEFDNVIDEAACPSIQGLGAEPTPADSIEFCRRAFIDLLGQSPTDVEYEQECKWRETDELVDAFMARPEYILTSQRAWADLFQMNSAAGTNWAYIADLDAKAGELHAGTITLGQFAELASTHPGFLGRWDGLDLVAFAFRAFLGREATPAERLALEPLWHLWEERDVPDAMQANAKMVVVDTNNCASPNQSACNSDFWGDQTVIIDPPMPGAPDPELNVIDQATLTDAQWAILRTPGQSIATQENFYESYVDRALVRYLGYDAGAELPLVRQALVDLMVANGGNVRDVDREILTSILYTSTNRYEEPDELDAEDWDPPYWHGPIKQMDAEDWLRSANKLAGLPVASCDHRYPEVQMGAGGFHPHTYPVMEGGTAPDYTFRDKAQLLGGCPDRIAQFRESRTGLIAALTQATLTAELCAMAGTNAPIYPLGVVDDPNDKSEAALWAAVDQVYSAAMIRPVMDGAADGVQTGITLCRDDGSCTATEFAVQACRLVLKSADFIYY
jgi:hypothetical protein